MIRCIVIDDEPLAMEQMAAYVERSPQLQLVESFDSPLEALAFLQNNKIDLMFVDIEMPDLTGIELVRSLTQKPKVIFTTAYREYAVEGFAVDAADYLLKPIGYADFIKSVNKVISRYFPDPTDAKQEANTSLEQTKNKDGFIFVKSGYKVVRIELNKVVYLEAMREYVKIVLDGGEAISTLTSIKSIEMSLPASQFMRIHRSFIINLSRVEVIERNRVSMGGELLPVGNQYVEAFQEYYSSKILK